MGVPLKTSATPFYLANITQAPSGGVAEDGHEDGHEDQNIPAVVPSLPPSFSSGKEVSWLVNRVEGLELIFTNELMC